MQWMFEHMKVLGELSTISLLEVPFSFLLNHVLKIVDLASPIHTVIGHR